MTIAAGSNVSIDIPMYVGTYTLSNGYFFVGFYVLNCRPTTDFIVSNWSNSGNLIWLRVFNVTTSAKSITGIYSTRVYYKN